MCSYCCCLMTVYLRIYHSMYNIQSMFSIPTPREAYVTPIWAKCGLSPVVAWCPFAFHDASLILLPPVDSVVPPSLPVVVTAACLM